MAAVSLFWDTNMAAVTSCENTLLICSKESLLTAFGDVSCIGYHSVGCYRDTSSRVIQSLEGTDPILDGPYYYRVNPVAKCAVAAMRAGHSMFAVQDGGWCAASATAPLTFDEYGKSTACYGHGAGGPWANQVYILGKEVVVRSVATGGMQKK